MKPNQREEESDVLNKIPKEVEQAVTLPELKVPQFHPHVKESDLADFDKRDKKMLLFCSVLEQKADFLIAEVKQLNEHARRMEWELVVTRRRQYHINWFHGGFRWVVIITGSGAVAAILREVAARIFNVQP